MRPCFTLKFCLFTLFYSLSVNTASAEQTPSSSAIHGLEFIAPQDRFVLRVELRNNGYDTLFDSKGNKQSVGATLNNVNLDSSVLPALAAFGAGATLGTTVFHADVKTQRTEFTLGYGITQDFTVGVIIPYGKVTTHASFSINGGNIGFNPAFDPAQAPSATNPPLLPVGLGPTEAVGTSGVQDILSDPAFGFGYKPLKTTYWEGLGDPTLGLLWRVHKTSIDAIIVGGGIRFGMAEQVDPDNLLQVPIDDGSTDLRARAEYYRNLGNSFDLKLAAEYTYQSEDNVTRRIATSGDLLALESSKESLKRKLGNYYEMDIGVGKTMGDWRFSSTWHRYVKSADHYSSSQSTDTSSLESNTDLYANQWRIAASWSGIRSWKEGNFPIPLIVQLEMQQTYEAKNFPEVKDIYLQLTSFF